MSIKLCDVNYIYSGGSAYEKHALDGVNLEIEDGQFLGIIGHTGSGKSTLIQHFNGLLKPSSGQIFVNGKEITRQKKSGAKSRKEKKEEKKIDRMSMRELRRLVGLVFQYPEHQLFEATVLEDVTYGPKNMGFSKEEAIAKAKEAIRLVGLDESIYDESPFELSGGQKRRVAIAGVLAMEPEVLVLDEPTAGLDPAGRDEILDQIKLLHDTKKITVILVSHSMEDVARYVDRVVVMDKGQVKYDGTPKDVFSHYKHLESMGLAAPQVTYLMDELVELGLNVETNCTTVEEARDSILRALEK